MKKLVSISALWCMAIAAAAQAPKTELYDLIKKIAYDSTGYENVGNWAVGAPKTFPVKWQDDKITMSDDTAINFFRRGTANISIKGKTFMQAPNVPVLWDLMLKGPRMGYSSFSMISSPSNELATKFTIDSFFAGKPYKAKLLKSCDRNTLNGYYYYEVKLPKKDVFYIKFSWLSQSGKTAVRIDWYDSWSKYAVKLDCK